jgi:hypothetical protein
LVLAGVGCTGRTIVVVDPNTCSDSGSTSCTAHLTDDLIGFWRLDDGTGSAVARDRSLWSNDGTLTGLDPTTAWVADGPEGVALAPYGKGYVKVLDSTSIDSITDEVTVAAWVYLDGTIAAGDFATAISRQIGTTYDQHYHLSINSDHQAALYVTPARLTYIHSDSTVPSQTWVHLAGTYDGSQSHLYVGGIEVASTTATGSFAAETNPVILSGNGNAVGNVVSELFPGRLDEIMLYRRALSADEIKRIEGGALISPAAHTDAGGQ